MSRWSSIVVRSGRVRRLPVSAKTIWVSLLVQVMFSACPGVGAETGYRASRRAPFQN